MKKLIALGLVLLLLLPAGVVSAASLKPDSNITVLLEGEQLFFDVDPIQTEGTTFVQFTTIFKALGLSYEWIAETREVHGYNDKIDLWLTLDSRYGYLNGEVFELAVAPFAYEGRTLVPLRFVSQSTGLQVDWDGANKLIEIYTKNGPSAPSAKSIIDYVEFNKGVDQTIVKKFYPDLPSDESDFSIQYDLVELFDYNTQLYFNFSGDQLYGTTYYYGRYGEKESNVIDVYNDIVGNLQLQYGKPRISEVRSAWSEGVDTKVITKKLTDSELLKGVKNEDYEVITEWNAKDGTIRVELYLNQFDDVANIAISFMYK